jgi:hypothetical protein
MTDSTAPIQEIEMREEAEDEEIFANILLYGPPGSGKSAGAATVPGRVLYINADLKNATRFARKREGKRLVEPVLRYEPGKTRVLDTMNFAVLSSYEGRWDAVVVDPVGEFYNRLLIEQTQKTRRPTLDARGNATTDLERWLKAMCEAPVNFIIVAHQLISDAGDEVMFMPNSGSKSGSLTGLGPKITGMVDIVGYTAVVEVEDEPQPKYMAQLIDGKGRQGKDRFDILGTHREIILPEWLELAGLHTTSPAQ